MFKAEKFLHEHVHERRAYTAIKKIQIKLCSSSRKTEKLLEGRGGEGTGGERRGEERRGEERRGGEGRGEGRGEERRGEEGEATTLNHR